MQKILFPLLLLLLSTGLGSQSLPSALDWVESSSPVVGMLKDLYVSQGLALPSASAPLSRAELLFYMEKIDRSALDGAQQKLWTALELELAPEVDYEEKGIFAADTGLAVAVEGYFGAGNPVNRLWDRGWGERPAMMDWFNRFWMTPFAYAEFHIDARQDPLTVLDQRGPAASNSFISMDQLDGFFPSKGYLAFGLPHLELKWGRSPVEWGQGVTGNLLISNAAGVHDHLTLTSYWDWFKIQLLYMDMDSYSLAAKVGIPVGTGFTDASGNVLLPGLAQTNAFGFPLVAGVTKGDSAMDVSRRLVAHRFEFRLPGNMNLHITEALLFTATTLELRHLMPMFIYHNWFQQWNANPNFTIEWEWAPVKGLGLYAAILGDYVTTTFKDSWYQDPHPLAMGYQLGVKTAHSMGEGTFETLWEGVYLDPYTYLDEAVDWITMRRVLTNYQNFVSGSGLGQPQVMVVDSPLGYHLGPDSAAGLVRFAYRVPRAWRLAAEAEIQFKGQITLRSLHPLLTNSPDLDKDNKLEDQDAGKRTLWDADSMKTLIFRLLGEVQPSAFVPDIPEALHLSAGLLIKGVKNGLDPFRTKDPLKPLPGNDYLDIQGTLGFKWTW